MKITLGALKNIIKEVAGSHWSESERAERRKRYGEYWSEEDGDVPDDYEECGYCGYDHTYNPEEALQWHTENDFEGDLYK